MQYDDICEVFTDKLVAKIPSTHDGVIKKINFKNDDICLVGKALVELEVETAGEASATTAAPETPKQETQAKSIADTSCKPTLPTNNAN